MSPARHDIGHGVSIEQFDCQHGRGGYWVHFGEPSEDFTKYTMGSVSTCRECVGDRAWTVEQEDPLTLSPSILTVGGTSGVEYHGFIREGRWVPA